MFPRCRSEWLSVPRVGVSVGHTADNNGWTPPCASTPVGGLALNTLAEEAGVSNGTVYNYFRSREAVLEAVGLELTVQLSEQILTVSEAVDSGAERLSIAVRTFMNKARSDNACAPPSPPTSAPTSKPAAAKAASTTPTKKWP